MGKAVPRMNVRGNRKLTFALRLLLGATLLIFGLSKVPESAGFVNTVISYRVLPLPLAKVYGLVMPWAEVTAGLCLILGLMLKFVAPAAIFIGVSLIVATGVNLYWLGAGGEDCGCLGGVDWPLGTGHLAVQGLMVAMAAQIWLHKGEFLSLDARLSPQRGDEGE